MSSLTQLKKHIRHISGVEWFHNCMAYRNIFSGVWLSARYTQGVDRGRLIKALKMIIRDQPWLLANVFYDVEGSRFTSSWALIDEIDLDSIVEFITTDDYVEDDPKCPLNEKTVQQIIGDGLGCMARKRDRVLWKVVVVNKVEVVFFWDHVLMDGKTAYFFHELLLKYLRELEHSDEETQITEQNNVVRTADLAAEKDIVLPPSPDDMMTYKPHFFYLLNVLIVQYLPRFFWPRDIRHQWKVLPPFDTTPEEIPERFEFPNNQIGVINMTSEETSNVIRLCKANHTTVTIYLSVLITDCISHFSGKKTIRMNIAADYRRSIPKDSKYLNGRDPDKLWGFLATTVEGNYNDEKPTSMWEKLSTFSKEFPKLITPQNLIKESFVSVMEIVPNMYRFLNNWVYTKGINPMFFSNLGYMKPEYKQDSKYNIERMAFMTCAKGVSSIIDSVTTNYNNSPVLTVTVSAAANFIRSSNQKSIDSLCDEIRERLRAPENDFEPQVQKLSIESYNTDDKKKSD